MTHALDDHPAHPGIEDLGVDRHRLALADHVDLPREEAGSLAEFDVQAVILLEVRLQHGSGAAVWSHEREVELHGGIGLQPSLLQGGEGLCVHGELLGDDCGRTVGVGLIHAHLPVIAPNAPRVTCAGCGQRIQPQRLGASG